MDTLRRDLEVMPQHSDLAGFRAETDLLITTSVKNLQAEQSHLEHNLNLTLSERELSGNQWKSVFEGTIAARIQDLWSGMHSTSRKLQEGMQFLQTDMIKMEDTTREMSDFVEQMKRKSGALERDTLSHSQQLGDQHKGIEQLFAMSAQMEGKLLAQETATGDQVVGLTERIESTEDRLVGFQKQQAAFAEETDTTLKNVCVDVVSCQSSLQAHQETLHSLDAGIMRQSAELMRMNDQLVRNEAKLGGLDGRVAVGEKKTATIATVVQEHYQELQHHVSQISSGLDQAASERGAMKRVSADLSFSIQETQQKLNEVGKLATTTDLGLTRTAAEIPKLHVLVSTMAANVAKNRQTIRDLTAMLNDEKLFSQALQTRSDQETALSVQRFADVAKRDEATQQAIQDAVGTTQSIKHTLEDAIRYNSNMIHQLNTMVDSIAITESADGMEDKLARFALSVAEFGLKLEHFGRNSEPAGPASAGPPNVKEDVKNELAVLLTKVIRFLGSGVAIDQNRYLLAVKRPQSVDTSSGVVVLEMPPQHMLEGFRLAKAALFCAKTRVYMDQLQPVLLTNRHATEFRDAFERKLRFVIEFGLANLFPNLGKPKNPPSKRAGLGQLGTCIACDRPIDDEQLEPNAHDECTMSGGGTDQSAAMVVSHSGTRPGPEHDHLRPARTTSFADDLVADEHQLRRQRIVSSAGPTRSSNANGNRIDTKSVIRGRSGNSGLRPKGSAEAVHHAPGAADFIYRAGFRLPKPTGGATSNANSQQSASTAALLFSGVIANNAQAAAAIDQRDPGAMALIDDGSCLERVALVGKCHQAAVEIPNANVGGVNNSHLMNNMRPHTAPYRTKSLPRLESLTTSTAVTTAGES